MFRKIKCRSVRQSLPGYVTHRLSSAERDRIDRHLAVCPECGVVHYSLRQAVELAEQARNAPLPVSLTGWADLRAQLAAAPVSVHASRPWRMPVLAGGAAALAVGVCLTWIILAQRVPQGNSIVHNSPASKVLPGRKVTMAGVPQTMRTPERPSLSGAPERRRKAAAEPSLLALNTDGSPPRNGSIPSPEGANVRQKVITPPTHGTAGSSPRKPGAIAEERAVFLAPLVQQREAVVRRVIDHDKPGLHPAGGIASASLPELRRILPQTDDLAYLNSSSKESLKPWTQRPPDEIHRLEVRLQQQVKGGDSFVRVPLPPIAGQGSSAVKAAVAAQQKEAAIVDARLVREIGLRMKRISFADLCAYLTKETGIQFTANRRVADDKVTLFCHPRPLRSIMRQIVRHFGFAWVRKGEEGGYEYELTQTLRSQLLEEGLRDRDQEEMLLAIDRSMERFRKYRGMSLEQINAQKGTRETFGDLFQLQRGGLVPMNLFFGLSQSEMDRLRAGQSLTLDLTGKDAALLPPNVVQGAGHSFDEGYERERKAAQERGGQALVPDRTTPLVASLRFDRGTPGEIALKGNLSDGTTGLGTSLAVAKSPAFTVDNAKTNAKLAADPELQRVITVKPDATFHFESTPYPDTESLYESPGNKVTTADVLENLFDASGIDILGDYFSHLQDPGSVTFKDVRLFAALNQLGDRMRMRWNKTGAKKDAWLQFRTCTFYYDRPQEIPNRLLERWKALRKKQGVMSLEDLTEVGQLPDAQLDSIWMAQAAIAVYGLDEWQMGRIAQLRPHWRFVGKLSDAQRREIWTEKGLAYDGLSADLQNQFLALAYDNDADRPGRHQIQGGNLRVLYAFATHPLQYGGSYAVLQTNPLLFVYTATTTDQPNRIAIVGPWNGIYGMIPEMLKPDAFSIVPGWSRP